jgi:hypothetical protein
MRGAAIVPVFLYFRYPRTHERVRGKHIPDGERNQYADGSSLAERALAIDSLSWRPQFAADLRLFVPLSAGPLFFFVPVTQSVSLASDSLRRKP